MPKENRSIMIDPQRVHLAEFARQDWVINAEEGTRIEDLKDPGYWANVSAQMKPYDRIEVRLETGEWIAELVVLTSDRNWARVHVLNKHELVSDMKLIDIIPQSHSVEWKGPHRKFCVIRTIDSESIRENFASKQEAMGWLINYEKVA